MWRQFKIRLKIANRFRTDLFNKDLFKYAVVSNDNLHFDYEISIEQEIKKNAGFENKLYNLELAAKKINQYVLKPGQIFSFFKIIGNPKFHFKKSRTIVNNVIVEDVGGGICQVSGIVYQISLIAGLEILERHNHSIDIYTEETRFTPLGTDATIVYGYKDLKIKNNFSFPVKFQIHIKENSLHIKLLSTQSIQKKELFFESAINGNNIVVNIFDSDRKLLNQSKYKKMNHHI
ncbi:VanW family protein [Flavobacterium artemisiae]|uniref:VanW family protein n=1 Tax=Flavobacterium artemisiae TaxID=2126556 RepID=A0ABW4HAE9_9FLAO